MNPIEVMRHKLQDNRKGIEEYLTGGSINDIVEFKMARAKLDVIKYLLAELDEVEKRYLDE